MCNERKSRERAIELGAVRVGVYSTTVRRYTWGGKLELVKEAFCSHYFNAAGLEVGYYHHILQSPQLNEMNPPRVWGPEALSSLDFSDLAVAA